MATLCSYKCQNYNSFMFKLYPYYVRLLYSTFIYLYYIQKNIKSTSKLHPLGTKNKIISFVRMKTFNLIL